MKRNFLLPSESMSYVTHDCRLEDAKYRYRNHIYEVSVLARLMSRTKKSINTFYDTYLLQPEELTKTGKTGDDKLPNINNTGKKERPGVDTLNSISNYNTVLTDLSDESAAINKENTKKPPPSKVIKEIVLNNNNASYGNIIWPYSITSTFNDDVILADTFEHRLLVFSREFIFKYQIGDTKGNAEGQFDEPADLVLNELGKLFVADKNNTRIQILTEQRKFKESKATKFSMGTNTESSKSKLLKSGSEYSFREQIRLSDKPIKLTSAPLASIVCVATEKGYFWIINESNQIVSYLQLTKPFDMFDLKSICLNESGDQLMCINSRFLKFYKIEQSTEMNMEASTYTLTNTIISEEVQEKNLVPAHMKLVKKVKLDYKYMPGMFEQNSMAQIKFRFSIFNVVRRNKCQLVRVRFEWQIQKDNH